ERPDLALRPQLPLENLAPGAQLVAEELDGNAVVLHHPEELLGARSGKRRGDRAQQPLVVEETLERGVAVRTVATEAVEARESGARLVLHQHQAAGTQHAPDLAQDAVRCARVVERRGDEHDVELPPAEREIMEVRRDEARARTQALGARGVAPGSKGR